MMKEIETVNKNLSELIKEIKDHVDELREVGGAPYARRQQLGDQLLQSLNKDFNAATLWTDKSKILSQYRALMTHM